MHTSYSLTWLIWITSGKIAIGKLRSGNRKAFADKARTLYALSETIQDSSHHGA